MDLERLLLELGINLTSSTIVEFVKKILEDRPGIDKVGLRQVLATFINVQGADIKAEKIIDFISISGYILIEGTKIYSGQRTTMYAGKGALVSFGNNSVSETPKTKIEAGMGARIDMQDGAGIKQNKDGSISFFTTNDK